MGSLNVRPTVHCPAWLKSPSRGTAKVNVVAPGLKVSVPATEVYSTPDTAVPPPVA